MSIYDITGVFSYELLDYILIMYTKMLKNTSKFILNIYDYVEQFILENGLYDKFDNGYLNHPIAVIFLTLGIILLCNLINKKFNEILYISNYNTSYNTCGVINFDNNQQNIYNSSVNTIDNNKQEKYELDEENLEELENNEDNEDNEDNENYEDEDEDNEYNEDENSEVNLEADDNNDDNENNLEYLSKYNIIKKNTELIESIDETSKYLRQYVTSKELNNFIHNNIDVYRNLLLKNSRLTDLEIIDLSYLVNNNILTDREFRYLIRKINQIFEKKVL